jgi:hypothetical protein
MERINALINKLQEQAAREADAAELLSLVQQLQAELVRHITAPATAPVRTAGTAKVAVMMPSANRGAIAAAAEAYAATVHEETPPARNGSNGSNGYQAYQPAAAAPATAKKEEAPSRKEDTNGWLFDPLKEIPTLAHQELPAKELNDAIGQQHTSLNDRLKIAKSELGDVLTEIPVKDLKKAIGINDRYVFVNELFRGDEAMYERSIKTINAFRILPEAEYWIERELKVKLAWDDGKTTTQHFYQLVKRRFS